MDRRRFIAGMGAASTLGLAASQAPADVQSARRPNIVLIMADDLGYREVGCFGQELIRTPHLDRLAAEGMRL